MRLLSHFIALFALSAAALAAPLEKRATPYPLGIDVNSFGSPVDWPLAISKGVQFAYFKATEALGTHLKHIACCIATSIG
jgi:GH25 family lysozyme M1 (1,4-beta-N-acetylmuramidase)